MYFQGGDTDESVDWLESKMQKKLPSEYVDFLLRAPHNSFQDCFVIPPNGQSTLKVIFSSKGFQNSTLLEAFERSKNELRNNLLHIGYDIGDNWICLDLFNGEVIWVDHESFEERCIAESFSSFVNKLTVSPKGKFDSVEILCRDGSRGDAETFLKDKGMAILSDSNRSLAQEAARYGNIEILKLCQELGYSLLGCIHLAAMNDKSQTVHYLVEQAGVSVNEINDKGWKPLQCVMFNEGLKEWLKIKGAT